MWVTCRACACELRETGAPRLCTDLRTLLPRLTWLPVGSTGWEGHSGHALVAVALLRHGRTPALQPQLGSPSRPGRVAHVAHVARRSGGEGAVQWLPEGRGRKEVLGLDMGGPSVAPQSSCFVLTAEACPVPGASVGTHRTAKPCCSRGKEISLHSAVRSETFAFLTTSHGAF